MSDNNNPIITCTQKQLAWDAWTKACGLGNGWGGETRTKAQQKAFDAWWETFAAVKQWSCLRVMIEAAWSAAPFLSYWQEIVDAQPVIGQVAP